MIAKTRATKRRPHALATYALGERIPARILEPADDAETAAILRAATGEHEAVVPWGGGTLQGASNPPSQYDVALLTQRLNRVLDYDPRDLTIGVGAGITLDALSGALREHGQFLPFDAPLPVRATVGGTLAAGWAGPRRASYGRPRDLLIGSTIALADGTLAKSGGMVVKNVTGYDVSKLYVGSHGTLGVLVRANFKLLPLPRAQRLASSPFDEDVRERLIANTAALAMPPAALLLSDGFVAATVRRDPRFDDTRARALALFEGSEETVELALRAYRSALGAAGVAETQLNAGDEALAGWQSIVDEYVAAGSADAVSFTLLGRGLPSDAPQRAAAVRACTERLRRDFPDAAFTVDVLTDLITGDVAARFRSTAAAAISIADAADALRDALRGRANLIAARLPNPRVVDAWGDVPSTLATMRALKQRFDPHRALAPGRYVGGI